MAKEQKSFSFPLLKPDNILSCMAELQIALTAEDLKEAPAAAVRRRGRLVVGVRGRPHRRPDG